MATAYVDLLTILDPVTGGVITAAWGDQIRENFEALIDPPACSVFHSTTQSVSSSTDTALNANTENYDNDSMHSTVSQTSRITIQKSGRYLIVVRLSYALNVSGDRAVNVRTNGSTVIQLTSTPASASGIDDFKAGAVTLKLNAGEYVEAIAYQTSGSSLNCTLHEFAALFMTRN